MIVFALVVVALATMIGINIHQASLDDIKRQRLKRQARFKK